VREGRAFGLGADRLLGLDLVRPFHGTRGVGASPAHSYLPRLRPGDRFSHTTAAALWEIPLPSGFQGDDAPLHVTATAPRNAPRARGVTGHRGSTDHVVTRHGLPVSPPELLFIEVASLLELDDLVSVGDALVLDPAVSDPRDPRPWIGLDDLRRAVENSSATGSRAARRALRWVRVGSESRMETLLRLIMVRAGLPEPELSPEVWTDVGRTYLGRYDMAYRAKHVIVEYDGDQHRTSTYQYERDIRRLERAREAGWTVVQVRQHGVFRDPTGTVARIRRALDRSRRN